MQKGEKEIENLFKMFDLNKDGFITEREIKKTLKNLGEKIKKKDVRKMMKVADLNKDGKISFPGKCVTILENTVILGLSGQEEKPI